MSTPTYHHYRLVLRSPAIVSTLSGDPNSSATQPFIPGAAIRGAVAVRLLTDGARDDGDEFRTIVLSGALRYLHAYPEAAGDRALPTPSSWKREKQNPDSAIDLAAFSERIPAGQDAGDFEQIWPEQTLSPVARPFIAPSVSAGTRATVAAPIDARLHQQRDREKGRPWKDQNEQQRGAIFAYEYLEADQALRGVIQVHPEAADRFERVKTLLCNQPILIGRSRRAGYGGEAALEFIEPAQHDEYANVSGAVSKNLDAGRRFRAMLTSAYIGRHPATGQIDPAALEHDLRERLGHAATIQQKYWAFETVGGFNRKWRLEVPQAQAVAAGTVLVLKAGSSIPVNTLRAIEHRGLGERRTEGFGRVLFLEHGEETEIRLTEAPPERRHTVSTESASGRNKEQLVFLEQRIVLTAVRAEIFRIAAIDLASKVQNNQIPTNSLLGRLRTVFRGVADEATAQAALQTLAAWCGDPDQNPDALKQNAREKLDKCNVGDQNLREWLCKLAKPTSETTQWDTLCKASGNPATLTGLAEKHHLTTPEAVEAVLHDHAAESSIALIDAVLADLARINRAASPPERGDG